FGEDREAAGEQRTSVLGDGLERQLAHVAGVDAVIDRARDSCRGDRGGCGIEGAKRLADRAHGAGAAGAGGPAARAERRLHRLELESCRQARALEALGGDLAVAEEALADADAAHLQALKLERSQLLADDE